MRRAAGLTLTVALAAFASPAAAAPFADSFERPDGPLGTAPDGKRWYATGGSAPTIREGQMVSAPAAPARAGYAVVTLDEVPGHMAMTFTLSGDPGRGDVSLGLLNNRPEPNGLLENVVHVVITNRSWAIGLVPGPIGWGGGLIDLSAGDYPELAPGTYTASMTRRGDTVELIDPLGQPHTATDPRIGAYWGARADWEIFNQTVGGREGRISDVQAGPGEAPVTDSYAPTSAPSTPDGGRVRTGATTLAGTAADHPRGASGVRHVDVSVQDLASGAWWDGARWVAGEQFRRATGTDAWQVGAPPLVERRSYRLRSRATDNAGNTQVEPGAATIVAEGPAARVAARGLSVRAQPRRDRTAPYRFALSGRLLLPAGLRRAEACRGTVAVRVARGTRSVRTGRARLRPDCTYRVRVSVARSRAQRGRLRITARFGGNARLRPRNARPIAARAG